MSTTTLSTPGSWFTVGDYTIGDSWDNGPVPNTTFSQTITANSDFLQNTVVMSWDWPDTASPTGAYGWSAIQYGFNQKSIQIQNLQSLNVNFSTAISGAPNNFDLSFDIVLTAQPGASSQPVCEIMYNLHRPPVWGQPGIPYSVGTVTGTADIFVENVPAVNLNNIPDVIVYPAQDTLTGTINLTDIIDPLVADGLISANDYFDGVQLGAETFEGSGSATINNFSVAKVMGQASFTLPAEQALVSF